VHFDTGEGAAVGAWQVRLFVAATCELRLANANCQWREQVPLKYPVHVHPLSHSTFPFHRTT